MATADMLTTLLARLEDEVEGLANAGEDLEAVLELRYGTVSVSISYDADEDAVRVGAVLPPPAGAGNELLLWALSLNARYWDVKVGLDEDGMLLVHADLDAAILDLDGLAAEVVDRVDSISDVIDQDLVDWVLARGLGTPTQRARWQDAAPKA
jgi:hypothetical protein